jgi:hypothetical protein
MRPCDASRSVQSSYIFLDMASDLGVQWYVRDGPGRPLERNYAWRPEGLIDIELIDLLNDLRTRVHDLNIFVNSLFNARHGSLISIYLLLVKSIQFYMPEQNRTST